MWGRKVDSIAKIMLFIHLCVYDIATSLIFIPYEKSVIFVQLEKGLEILYG